MSVQLNAAEIRAYSDRIATIAGALDTAYLVSSTPGAPATAVVPAGDTPAEGAAALARATQLGRSAQGSVLAQAEALQEDRAALVGAEDRVVDSSATVTKLTASQDADGTRHLTADVHFRRRLIGGPLWEEEIPYIVTVDPKTDIYTSLTIQDKDDESTDGD